MQVLSQAISARAPYAVLIDGVVCVFFQIKPCMDKDEKNVDEVVGWDVRYCAKHTLTETASMYEILHRLLREDHPADSDWPTPDRMFVEHHKGFPEPIDFLIAKYKRSQWKLQPWPGASSQIPSVACCHNVTEENIDATEENIGDLVRAQLIFY